ncbi:hypothetical protein A3K86_16915 [Photobacterium jeanii]|uniref:Uncharacterized protein n=1 Tax=Photobacterium jeanii TaxID=858640 RepID=A0A178K9K4_9GAMM|nr:hypothetical protein [Photobacterium jeanii]OAN13333.1 hypothetical protein A3K86_16915 [Photobacterium jeanii]PST90333.1 hypothetical protein C9I91_06715 [Photobacterium jeanii]
MRKYFDSVAGDIEQLVNTGAAFGENASYWSHLKHNEDYSGIFNITEKQKRVLVESLYVKGRTLALFSQNELGLINHDVVKFPNLTAVVDNFEGSILYANYSNIVEEALEVCKEFGVSLWSVDQMVELFNEQKKMSLTVRNTLENLKNSKLYKQENGIEVEDEAQTKIQISGITGSNIVVNSTGVNATITSEYVEPEIFTSMKNAVAEHTLSESDRQLINDHILVLSKSHKEGNFVEAYKEFTQGLSAHLTILLPFLPALSSLM